jgi:large subunit ribosomal protein L4
MEVKVLDFNGKDTGRKFNFLIQYLAIEPNNHPRYTLMLSNILAKDKERTSKK